MTEMRHLEVKFKCLNSKQKLSNSIIVLTVLGKDKKLSNKLNLFDSLNDFMRATKVL